MLIRYAQGRTGELCSVMPFSSHYKPRDNVPVARCATAYTCPHTGQSILLIADQVLWFGIDLPNTLINPNQVRSFGYSLCDDPWDPNRPLGLDTEDLFIPFAADGSTLYFDSRVPSSWELENLPTIVLTAPHWNPAELYMPTNQTTNYRTVDSLTTISESAVVLSNITSSLDERQLPSLFAATVKLRGVSATVTGTGSGSRLTAPVTT